MTKHMRQVFAIVGKHGFAVKSMRHGKHAVIHATKKGTTKVFTASTTPGARSTLKDFEQDVRRNARMIDECVS